MSGFFENGITPIHLLLVASILLAVVVVELGYMLGSPGGSAKKRINRRMSSGNKDKKLSQKHLLVQLRKERGLDEHGKLVLPLKRINALIVQAGFTLGLPKLIGTWLAMGVGGTLGVFIYFQSVIYALIAVPVVFLVLPYFYLKRRAKKKTNLFADQLPDAIDLITRSLKAGHPVPVAISMVAREMPDPIGTEFGMVTDEVTFGSDLVTALNSLYDRVSLEDLPLLISAVSIQSTTGGNLREILEGLASVIRDRGKMKRKVRAISAEGRISAMFLSALPFLLYVALTFIVPNYYSGIWHVELTWWLMGGLAAWLVIGNVLIFKMVSFKY